MSTPLPPSALPPYLAQYSAKIEAALDRATNAIKEFNARGGYFPDGLMSPINAARNSLRDHVANFKKIVEGCVSGGSTWDLKEGPTVRLMGDWWDAPPGAKAASSGPVIMGDYSALEMRVMNSMLQTTLNEVSALLWDGTKRDAALACWSALQKIQVNDDQHFSVLGQIKAQEDEVARLRTEVAALRQEDKRLRSEVKAGVEVWEGEVAVRKRQSLRAQQAEAARDAALRETDGFRLALDAERVRLKAALKRAQEAEALVQRTPVPAGMVGGAAVTIPVSVAEQVTEALSFYKDNPLLPAPKAAAALAALGRFFKGAKETMPPAPAPAAAAEKPTHIVTLDEPYPEYTTKGGLYAVREWKNDYPNVTDKNGGGTLLTVTKWRPAAATEIKAGHALSQYIRVLKVAPESASGYGRLTDGRVYKVVAWRFEGAPVVIADDGHHSLSLTHTTWEPVADAPTKAEPGVVVTSGVGQPLYLVTKTAGSWSWASRLAGGNAVCERFTDRWIVVRWATPEDYKAAGL